MPKKKTPTLEAKVGKVTPKKRQTKKSTRKNAASAKVEVKATTAGKAIDKTVTTKKASSKHAVAEKVSSKKVTAKKATTKKVTPNKAPQSSKPKKPSKAQFRAVIDSAKKRLEDHLAKTEAMSARVLPLAPDAAYERAVAALRHEEANLRSRPGFLFADVGYKFVGGRRTEEIAVRLHVTKKSNGPNCIDSHCCNNTVPTDVLVTRFTKADGTTTDAGDWIKSDGNNGPGTLGMGAAVLGGFPIFITCAHVVSKQQPPTVQHNVLVDINQTPIATSLNDNPTFFRYDEEFDLALAIPADAIQSEQMGRFVEAPDSGVQRPNRIIEVTSSDMDRMVYKFGAKTGFRKGFIDSVKQLPIPVDELEVTDHVIIRSAAAGSGALRPFADKGDSGAIVFTEDGGVIGMVRGVSDDRERTIITRMTSIQNVFSIETTFTS